MSETTSQTGQLYAFIDGGDNDLDEAEEARSLLPEGFKGQGEDLAKDVAQSDEIKAAKRSDDRASDATRLQIIIMLMSL